VKSLIRRARRRIVYNELFAQGAIAFSAALLAFILLLLMGTQILDWRWLFTIPSAALGVGLYRLSRRVPADYTVAQLLDRRLALADTLSTATFYGRGETRLRPNPAVRASQLEDAERLAATVDARAAIPFVVPRGVYALAVLVLVASSLFALRYGLSRRLDLKPPLARILLDKFGPRERGEEAREARRKSGRDPELNYADRELDRDDPRAGEADAPPQPSGQMSKRSAAERSRDGGSKNSSKRQSQDEKTGDSDRNADLDSQPPERDRKNGDAPPSQEQGKSAQTSKAAAQQPSGNESSNLLSKLQDAMKNLLSRMSMQPPARGTNEGSSNAQSGRTAPGKSKSGNEKAAAKSGEKQPGGEESDPQAGQTGQDNMAAQSGQTKGDGKSDSNRPSQQPGNGIGSQDGAKDVKLAEQLAAMGKISEILGKRSANLTGEATVEAQSTTQQLHTPYAQRRAEHTEGGAGIGRDEVPVALEPYVEQYFEQVRKPGPKR
jgi:hypothetical protein